jgi:hypothetical protein
MSMKDIQRYEAQYGPVIDDDLPQPHLLQWSTGLAVLYSDYVKDTNERLEMIAHAIEIALEDGRGISAADVRALKIKL